MFKFVCSRGTQKEFQDYYVTYEIDEELAMEGAILAVHYNNTQVLETLLHTIKLPQDDENQGKGLGTLLILALEYPHHMKCIQIILEAGANPKPRSSHIALDYYPQIKNLFAVYS